MILRIIGFCCLLIVSNGIPITKPCLTGYMTDVQSWVDKEGSLTVDEAEARNAINLYSATEPVISLQQQMTMFRSNKQFVKYLGMAKCGLNRVPPVFELKDTTGRPLFETVYYITLYGNQFQDVSSEGDQYDININATDASEVTLTVGYGRQAIATWSAGFNDVNFPKLRELDIRSCGIQVLSDRLFYRMQNLEALYLGENRIMHISAETFYGLVNLIHLDLSRNYAHDKTNEIRNIRWDNHDVFAGLTNLQSLDLSHTRLSSNNMNVLTRLGRKFQRLSLCWSGLQRLGGNFFNGTSLKYLDLSGNNGILNGPNVLGGTENTLTVLYAENIGLKTFEIFYKFDQLEILKLTNNEVTLVTGKVTTSLKSIRVLDLDNNRITSWFAPLYSYMSRLKLLSLRDNNINMITEDMIRDFENISYIALSGNYMVCNCHSRDLFELAVKNEENYNESYLVNYDKNAGDNKLTSFHTAYDDFNDVIRNRKNVTRACTKQYCEDNIDFDELEFVGNFVLIDYSRSVYHCLSLPEGTMFPISGVQKCNTRRDIDYEDIISENRNKLLFLLVIPLVVLPVLIFCYVFRRNFKYFLITMRNSAMLSLINKNSTVDDDTIYNYDVFVSYCNEDREWVLDQLLPHVERDCSVSVCLHERDFQVGLSILENIVSCMDRSRFIMLIISQKFLLSQWCQFEMHLAQHRLLETRREDLILVLLEEIPRRVRPNTLHYLMLTKTYIVWPKDRNNHAVFWRRVKKSLMTDKLKRVENSSLA